MHAKYDARDTTRAARQTFLARFEREVDPDGSLPLQERAKRAEMARKAYFHKLAAESARVRRERVAARAREQDTG